jgi:Mor family transcriptional regulator
MSSYPSLMQFPENYPEQLEQIGQILYRELLDIKMSEADANAKAFKMVEALRSQVGGGAIYFPMGMHYQLSIRDEEIWAKFKGNNIPALAIEYGLSQMQIRNILAVARARDTAKRQSNLFDDASA